MRPNLLPMAVFLLMTLASLTTALHAAASPNELGPRLEPGELRAGGLLLEDSDGLRAAPMLETDVEIRVTGLIARTIVTQRFRNPTQEWVEGIYVFPLPDRSAVDTLRMRIGAQTIEGQVQERARARATYKKAKTEGRKASLVEQERPNIFTTSVANLGPGEELEVTLEYQEDARYERGEFSLRFPMVVAPRFIPGSSLVEGFTGSGWAGNTDEVPDAERITPPVLQDASERVNLVTIRARLDVGFRLEDLESPSHRIRIDPRPDEVYEVVLEAGAVRADSDFVLAWKPVVGQAPRAALFREEWAGEHYALLMVLPPDPENAERVRLSRETIIVIDTSGSMGGESIAQARRAVSHALSKLQPDDAFNVIRFESRTEALFPTSRAADREAIAEADRWVARLEANGGTMMLPALEAALREGPEQRAVRQVIFMTDGAVGNETALFSAISKRLGKTRLYPVGIGSAPNSHFMTKAAQFGRGTFTYIANPREVEEKMNGLFSKLDHPVLHDLAADWNGAGVEAWPSRIPDIYLGEPVVIAARLPDRADRVALHGRRGEETVQVELGLQGGSKHTGVARIWARRKIASLMDTLAEGADIDRVSVEVAGLGIRHHLVTRWTSLVAVDVTPTAPIGVTPETRPVPTELPKGWDAKKVLGNAQTEAIARARASSRPIANISQPMAFAPPGQLPQGATPSGLLLMIGSLMLSAGGMLWRFAQPAAQSADRS